MIDRRELLSLATASVVATATNAHAALAAAPRISNPHGKPLRSAEIRALRKFAEQTHPRGREARDDRLWQSRWARLERTAQNLSDGAYFVEARRAIAWFEDGHTTVLPFEFLGKVPDALAAGPFGLRLPWRVKLFDDGAYVVAAENGESQIFGARVDRVGSMTVPALVRALDTTWPGNRAWAHNWGGIVFASPAQLQGLGAMKDGRSAVPVRISGVSLDEFVLSPRREETLLTDMVHTKSEREAWAAAIGRGNYVKALPDRRALYVSIDDMDDVEGATFEQLTKDLFSAMDLPAADRLVIDLRRNGGGNNFLGEALRKHVERSRFNRPGGLYVLIGPATFSAAQNLANRLERETYATFVGTPTGLSPNHYGDAKIFTGPSTGLTAMVSTLPWFDSYPQDKRAWIMPDLLVPSTFADWRDGRDSALALALTHRSESASDDLSDERVFYYNRASQKAEWRPFWV